MTVVPAGKQTQPLKSRHAQPVSPDTHTTLPEPTAQTEEQGRWPVCTAEHSNDRYEMYSRYNGRWELGHQELA